MNLIFIEKIFTVNRIKNSIKLYLGSEFKYAFSILMQSVIISLSVIHKSYKLIIFRLF